MKKRERRGGTTPWIVVLGVLAIAAAVGLQAWRGRQTAAAHAATSELFSHSMTLAEANETAAASGKPVLVFATADWCGPCQMLKRDTLTDPDVADRIRSKTVAVYLDVTDSVPREAAGLGIQGIPALIALRDGKEVSRLVGYRDAGEMVQWLDSL